MAGIGAEYIEKAPDFAEARSHKQNPLQALQGQIRKVVPPCHVLDCQLA